MALANGLVHLPDHPTVAERAAAIDWILAMARNPRICPPEEIRALAERRRVAQERWRAAEDAAEAIEFALPSELRCLSAAKQASAAALAAAGHPEAEALAARLFEEKDALEREFVRLVPTTLETLLIFAAHHRGLPGLCR